jgi:hypothetical protein
MNKTTYISKQVFLEVSSQAAHALGAVRTHVSLEDVRTVVNETIADLGDAFVLTPSTPLGLAALRAAEMIDLRYSDAGTVEEQFAAFNASKDSVYRDYIHDAVKAVAPSLVALDEDLRYTTTSAVESLEDAVRATLDTQLDDFRGGELQPAKVYNWGPLSQPGVSDSVAYHCNEAARMRVIPAAIGNCTKNTVTQLINLMKAGPYQITSTQKSAASSKLSNVIEENANLCGKGDRVKMGLSLLREPARLREMCNTLSMTLDPSQGQSYDLPDMLVKFDERLSDIMAVQEVYMTADTDGAGSIASEQFEGIVSAFINTLYYGLGAVLAHREVLRGDTLLMPLHIKNISREKGFPDSEKIMVNGDSIQAYVERCGDEAVTEKTALIDAAAFVRYAWLRSHTLGSRGHNVAWMSKQRGVVLRSLEEAATRNARDWETRERRVVQSAMAAALRKKFADSAVVSVITSAATEATTAYLNKKVPLDSALTIAVATISGNQKLLTYHTALYDYLVKAGADTATESTDPNDVKVKLGKGLASAVTTVIHSTLLDRNVLTAAA